MFQFTPAHGGRHRLAVSDVGPVSFNSRPRTAGDRLPAADARPRRFQFTPAHGGRRRSRRHGTSTTSFQFTPAHGGRLEAAPFAVTFAVSIHARARRATSLRSLRRTTSAFQFTPAHGGRLPSPDNLKGPRKCFNSRPRTAGDGSADSVTGHAEVSIHARARRATRTIDTTHCHFSFNSRPRTAGDPDIWTPCNR